MKKSTGFYKKTNNNKLKIFLLVLLGIVIIVITPVSIHLFGQYKEKRVVVNINGEPVLTNEFKMILMDNRANTYSYFKQKYGVDDSVDFWTKSIGGEVPIEYIRKKALEIITEIKIEQSLAKQKGIVSDIAYPSLLKQMDEENKARREAVSKGQVIYGPMNYGEREYFRYVHSNMLIKLKGNLGENEFKISDEELKKLYEVNKDKNYKIADEIKVLYIKASYIGEKGSLKNDNKADAKAKVEQLKSKLDKGESFESVLEAKGIDGSIKISSGERKFDSSSRRSDGEDAAKILEVANNLKVGQISGVVEEQDGFYILKCTEIMNMGYRSFDEVKNSVVSEYIDKKFDEMINRLVKDARIEIDENIYKNINIR